MKQKQLVHNSLREHLQQKAVEARASLTAAIESRNSDTKSSAGDKHETGREMIQQVIDMCQAETDKADALLVTLKSLDPASVHTKASMGSLISTNHGWYYISVGTGKIKTGDLEVFCISPGSPIGKAFMGLQKGENITFNGREYRIIDIS